VKVAMRYGGNPCGETSETIACNAGACEKDCKLSSWTPWSKCSKACDGGSKKRVKFIKTGAVGEGKCPDMWDFKRLQYKKCNTQRCALPKGKKVLECNATQQLDVILLIDGSSSLGTTGWKAEIKAATMFVSAFKGDVAMSVILYSGPRTYEKTKRCVGRSEKKVDIQKECKINTVAHFTKDLDNVKERILALDFPKGSTLTSLALLTAKSELQLGRKDARSVVVVFTDGRPHSYRKTAMAARSLRKKARLIWVPITKFAPLKKIKELATRRWQENVVVVNSFEKLRKPEVVTHLIADLCPTPTQFHATLGHIKR